MAVPLRRCVNILQRYFNMKQDKKKWEPRIINIMADGSQVDDLTGYVIPAGHSYYNVIKRFCMEDQTNEIY